MMVGGGLVKLKISKFSVKLIHEKIILKVRQSIELVGGMNPQRELIHFIIQISRDKLGQRASLDIRPEKYWE